MYLVTGASGKLGRAVIHHMLTTYKVPAAQVIAASRDVSKLADLAAKGVHTRAADFGNIDSLTSAFAGAKRILIISTDAMAPGERVKQQTNAVSAAAAVGAEHVLYTSMPAPETSAVTFAGDHLNTEKALAASGLKGWTVLRHNWYFENLFMSLPQALTSGTLYTAAQQGKLAQIARDDLARADAAALINASGKHTYTLTGAEAHTTEDIAQLVSKATGKPLNVVHVPAEGLVQGMLGAGLPEPMARMIASFDVNTAQGGLATITGDYKALTGQEPQRFADWVKASAGAFAG
jgi:NAD(P)H dehydrogenase (quinone)